MSAVILQPTALSGEIAAISSKSQLHRLLICAALGSVPVTIRCGARGADIAATMQCLNAMGADIAEQADGYVVHPVRPSAEAEMDAGESGSTLRFLLPVIGALGIRARIRMHGRLPERPLEPLAGELTAHGMTLTRPAADMIETGGRLRAGAFTLPGNISSQYISGLCFALPLLDGESEIHLTTELESAAYLQMTMETQRACGIEVKPLPDGWRIPGRQTYRASDCRAEGDWSNAAFPLCAGALGGSGVTVTGLNRASVQGDRAVFELLRRFGADCRSSGDSVTVGPGVLHGIEIDAAPIPDLVPVLAAVAVLADGETRIIHAGRLRLKESDRLQSVCACLRALGADIAELPDGLRIHGRRRLDGGTVSAAGDHRIAMTAAVASIGCVRPVRIDGAESVAKSDPSFWDGFASLGGSVSFQSPEEFT